MGFQQARADLDVFADADNEHAVPGLGHPVFLGLHKEQARVDLFVRKLLLGERIELVGKPVGPVAYSGFGVRKVANDAGDRWLAVDPRREQALYVLHHEHGRLVVDDDLEVSSEASSVGKEWIRK